MTTSVYGADKPASSTAQGATNTFVYYKDGSEKSNDNSDASVAEVVTTYDRSGQVLLVTDGGATSQYVTMRNKVGEEVRSIEANGATTGFEYDRNGNQTKRTVGNIVEEKTYGTSGNSRNLQTRTQVKTTLGSTLATVDFGWTDNGELSTVTRDTTHDIKTTYGFQSETDSVASVNTELVASPYTDYQTIDVKYDAAKNIRKSERDLRLVDTSTGTNDREYTFDAEQRITKDTTSDTGIIDRSYAYDSRGRLDAVSCVSGGSVLDDYTYPTAGSSTHSAHVSTIVRRTACGGGTATNTLAYSSSGLNRGNLSTVTGGAVDYTTSHDARGRLTSVTRAGTTEARTFDAQNRTATRTTGGVTRTSGYSGEQLNSDSSEGAGGHGDFQVIVDPRGREVAEIRNGTPSWILTDEIGSSVENVEASEVVSYSTDFDSYGQREGLSSGSNDNAPTLGYRRRHTTQVDTESMVAGGGFNSSLRVGTKVENKQVVSYYKCSSVNEDAWRVKAVIPMPTHSSVKGTVYDIACSYNDVEMIPWMVYVDACIFRTKDKDGTNYKKRSESCLRSHEPGWKIAWPNKHTDAAVALLHEWRWYWIGGKIGFQYNVGGVVHWKNNGKYSIPSGQPGLRYYATQ